MNYDEHEATSDPGPIASQDWFVANLTRVLKSVPKEKLICALGNYGYDWTLSIPPAAKRGHKQPKPQVLDTIDLPVSDAWQRASDADADLNLDYDSLNPHFDYIDEDNNQRHVVWFLDAVTLLNEMRAARQLGLQTFALWRLGSEDSSLWNVWDKPSNPASLEALRLVEPGHSVDTEGEGDIMRVTGLPQRGTRARCRSTRTSLIRARSSSSTSIWMSIRRRTPFRITATIRTRLRFRLMTGLIPNGHRAYSTS